MSVSLEQQNAKLVGLIDELADAIRRTDELKAVAVSSKLEELAALGADEQQRCLGELWNDGEVRRLLPLVQGQRPACPSASSTKTSSSVRKLNEELRGCLRKTEARARANYELWDRQLHLLTLQVRCSFKYAALDCLMPCKR